MANRYKVYVCLEADYDDIIADSEEEAFLEASDFAMEGGSWQRKIELVEEGVDDSEDADY